MSAVESGFFELEESGDVVVARMSVATIRHPPQAQDFSRDLVELLEVYKRTKVVVNLRGVHYFGSSAFAALFGLAKRLNDAGGRLALCELDPDLMTGANILGLGTVATMYETEREAVESFGEA